MKALLVYPEWPDTYWSFKHALRFEGKRAIFPPLGLLTVSSMLPKTWEKRLIDINIRKVKDADLDWADVVMVSAMLVQREGMMEILARCRQRGIRSVVGGPIASCMENLSQYADHVVVGEAEDIVADLAAALERGDAKPQYKAAQLPELDHSPLPDLDLIEAKYYSTMGIQFSRGCPFNCEFCDIIEMYGRKPRTKSPAQIVAELELLAAHNWNGSIFVVDDNFIGNKRKVKELLPVMAEWNSRRERPFSFFTEASVNMADDDELLQMMRNAHFDAVFVGIETPSQESLKETQKMQNTHRNLLENVHHIQSYGIEVMAGFIVGFDNDTPEIFDRQVEFIEQSAIPLAFVGLLQPLPNTQLYRRLIKEGRLVSETDGHNLDLRLSFIPRMDSQQLLEGLRSILTRLYNPKNYYARVSNFLAHYPPTPRRHPPSLGNFLALLRSILRQGIFSRYALSYWRLIFAAATRYRQSFASAIRLAIMGYHFERVTNLMLARAAKPPVESSVAPPVAQQV